jgi:hypothetical protein
VPELRPPEPPDGPELVWAGEDVGWDGAAGAVVWSAWCEDPRGRAGDGAVVWLARCAGPRAGAEPGNVVWTAACAVPDSCTARAPAAATLTAEAAVVIARTLAWPRSRLLTARRISPRRALFMVTAGEVMPG